MKSKTYEEFVEKFKPKLTTDDCITPPEIYEVVKNYVRERWGISLEKMVRPFWPGGDFEAFEYPACCCVVDNPPFSILSRIQEFYLEKGISFFLFAPQLTCLSSKKNVMQTDHIVCNAQITYENGARVSTAFVTNLDSEYVLESDPNLGKLLNDTDAAIRKKNKIDLPQYEYPAEVITAARMGFYASNGTVLRIKRDECVYISNLDHQKQCGKKIFGGGLLLSERSTDERCVAEKVAVAKKDSTIWELSEREREIVCCLSQNQR